MCIVVEKYNNVYFKILCDNTQSNELYNFLDCFTNNYKYDIRYKMGQWNGKISFFNLYTHLLPIGLLYKLVEFAKYYNYKLKLNFDKSEFYNNVNESEIIKFYGEIFKDNIYPRDYQHKSILRAINLKRGIINSATGSGKSLIIYAIIRYLLKNINDKILLVVPNISLTIQMFNDFSKDYGWESAKEYISILYNKSKDYDINKKILISTWQSIYKHDESFFKDFGAVIVDETHSVRSISIQNILKNSINAKYRIGLTGTLPDEKIDLYNIFGYLGYKLITVKNDELIKDGFLSNIKINNLIIKYPDEIVAKNKNNDFKSEYKLVIEYKFRNEIFSYIINNINNTDNILILCERIDHLNNIYEHINPICVEKNRKVYKIFSGINKDVREDIRSCVENNDGVVIVATFGTMSMGINIKKLHHIVLGSSYKSKIKILQSIGRGLRLHITKHNMMLWDLVDDLTYNNKNKIICNYLYKHFLLRVKYYNEQNFEHKKIILNIP